MKEKWLEKQLIILLSGLNSELRGSKEEKTSLNWLSMSTKWPLIRSCWYLVNKLSKRGWVSVGEPVLFTMRDQRIWLSRRACTLSWDLPLSSCKYNWMEVRPAIVSAPNKGAVLNAPVIYKATHLWSFPKIFNR